MSYIYVQVYVFKGKSHNFGDHQPESNVPNYFDLQLSIWLVFIRYRYLEWECIRWDESSIFVTCYQKAYQQRLKVLITYLFQGVLFKVQKKRTTSLWIFSTSAGNLLWDVWVYSCERPALSFFNHHPSLNMVLESKPLVINTINTWLKSTQPIPKTNKTIKNLPQSPTRFEI